MERTSIKLLVGFLKHTKLPLQNLSHPTLLVLNYWMPLSSTYSLFQRINGKKHKKSFEPFSNAIWALFTSHVPPRLASSLLPSGLPLPLTSKLPPPSSSWMLMLRSRWRQIISSLQFATQMMAVQQRSQTIVVESREDKTHESEAKFNNNMLQLLLVGGTIDFASPGSFVDPRIAKYT
jgi:hypothetical protein